MAQDQVEQASERIAALWLRLTSSWVDFDTAQAEGLDNAALCLLCGAGMARLRFRGRAWTDQTALDFEATVCGVWIDRKRNNLLSNEMRRAVPAWAGKAVAIELNHVLQARLTTFGLENQREIEADPQDVSLLTMLGYLHQINGRVGVQIIGNQAPSLFAVMQDAITGCGIMKNLEDIASVLWDINAQARHEPFAQDARQPSQGGG